MVGIVLGPVIGLALIIVAILILLSRREKKRHLSSQQGSAVYPWKPPLGIGVHIGTESRHPLRLYPSNEPAKHRSNGDARLEHELFSRLASELDHVHVPQNRPVAEMSETPISEAPPSSPIELDEEPKQYEDSKSAELAAPHSKLSAQK
jgi:hypothetical protein